MDTSDLDAEARKVDRVLLDLLENMQTGQPGQPRPDTPPEFDLDEASDAEIARSAQDDPPAEPSQPQLDKAARDRIDRLFDAARKDRSQRATLKQALDTLGVFAEYENRFLDLFKQSH